MLKPSSTSITPLPSNPKMVFAARIWVPARTAYP